MGSLLNPREIFTQGEIPRSIPLVHLVDTWEGEISAYPSLIPGIRKNSIPHVDLFPVSPRLASPSADCDDVVTERSIADACESPVCTNPLPDVADPKAEAPRFHISLREHRVYDLVEARKFCSERCLFASAAFAASLPPSRPFGVPPERLDALVALFEGHGDGLGLGFAAGGGKEDNGRKMEIREKEAPGPGEVTLQEWIGPPDAIEGYVPRCDRIGKGHECAQELCPVD